jgi:hypothetical protein
MLEHRYQILIRGRLGEIACQAFDGFTIEPLAANTALIGDLDQAALHGALNRAWSLGLELIEVVRLHRDEVLS